MAVYDGVPSIRLEGDEERALALVPEAKALLYKVQTFKQRAEVGTFSMSRRVDDDSTIYVLSSHGQNLIHIAVAPDVPEQVYPKDEIPDPTLFPDFYSGLVYNGYLEERTRTDDEGNEIRYSVCVSFSPTPTCQRTHEELSGGRQEVPRLAVRPWVAFDELNNNSPSGRPVFTQYTKLRSSMYSGTMKKVAQIAMGLGRIGKAKLRDPRAVKPDSKYIKDVDANGVQIRYDWRFIRTHGITIAADGRLWIVEISSNRGVIARPLPIFPHSMTEGFRERAEARGDSAMTTALDELGCLPTGEAFPNTAAQVNELIERGEILRLLEPSDLSDFYRCSAYSSAMGWAFNERGNEAHNTAYYFGDDGFQRGVWYQVNISIGAIKEDWEPGEPIANGSANLRKNTEGYIYCPPAPGTSYARYVPIKFHEPMFPGLLSHEGVPDIAAAGLPVPKVDTPMFVSFVDGDLKVVKYYRNPKEDTYTTVDDPRYPGECILAGSWTITETYGSRTFPTMMYSNDFDDRKVLQEQVKTTHIDSKDLGFDTPVVSDFITYPRVAHVSRSKVFRRTTVVDNRIGETICSAVAIPQYSREAYYYATASSFGAHNGSTSVGYDMVGDPNTAYTWRCFPQGGGPAPWPDNLGCTSDKCGGYCNPGGVGAPKERRVVCLAYEPGPCSDFADSGPWLEICQDVDPFIGQPEMPKPTSHVSWDLGADSRANLYLISPGYGGPLSIPVTASQVFNHWMTPSPDPVTQIVQFIYAEHSAIGNDMLVYATNLSSYQGGTRTYGYAPDSIGPNDGYPAFVGVNKP